MLARHLVGSGATALGRANYADKKGEYYTAFFGLSIGLERLAKLVLVADHTLSNNGRMPSQQVVRQYRHRLEDLLDKVEEISQRRNLQLEYTRPDSEIADKMVRCLDAFADAGRGRYANFAALGDPNLGGEEPISTWWRDVAEAILQNHYYGKAVQHRVERRAEVIDAVMSPMSMVLFFNESGEAMQDVMSASVRTGQTEIVQKWSRYYALTIVRWVSEVLSELAREADGKGFGGFFGLWEYFWTYTVDNQFLKTRKIWPLN